MDRFECADLVEEVTNYLDRSLDTDGMARMARHLRGCWACGNYVGEIEAATRLMSELPAERISGDLESALLAMYRRWAASVTV